MTFYFDPKVIHTYYTCEARDYNGWTKEMEPNVILGCFYISIEVFFYILYIPALFALRSPELKQYNCYRLMFWIGLWDCGSLILSSYVTGYLTIRGDVFCTNPVLIYICGSIAMMEWCGYCALVCVLGFTRVMDIINPKLCDRLFDGSRLWIWISVCVIYSAYFPLFSRPVLYNSKYYAWFYSPYVGIEGDFSAKIEYVNFAHLSNNIGVITCLGTLYTLYLILFLYKIKVASLSDQLSSLQKLLFLQCFIILFGTMVASVLYDYMNWLPVGVTVVVISQLAWISSCVTAPIAYLFNPTIRRYMWEHFFGRVVNYKHNTVTAPILVTPNDTCIGNFGEERYLAFLCRAVADILMSIILSAIYLFNINLFDNQNVIIRNIEFLRGASHLSARFAIATIMIERIYATLSRGDYDRKRNSLPLAAIILFIFVTAFAIEKEKRSDGITILIDDYMNIFIGLPMILIYFILFKTNIMLKKASTANDKKSVVERFQIEENIILIKRTITLMSLCLGLHACTNILMIIVTYNFGYSETTIFFYHAVYGVRDFACFYGVYFFLKERCPVATLIKRIFKLLNCCHRRPAIIEPLKIIKPIHLIDRELRRNEAGIMQENVYDSWNLKKTQLN
uniref:Serpentine receptor class gamma n=1 Tax=Rhabditophanes sp. KR3021 TaxID=114890 RepID=A0AC35TNA1_9BILA